MDLFDLYASLSLDTADYSRALSQADRETQSFATQLQRSLTVAAAQGAGSIQGASTAFSRFTTLANNAGDYLRAAFDQINLSVAPAAASLESLAGSMTTVGGVLRTAASAAGQSLLALSGAAAGISERLNPMLTALGKGGQAAMELARGTTAAATGLSGVAAHVEDTLLAAERAASGFPVISLLTAELAAGWETALARMKDAAQGLMLTTALVPVQTAAAWSQVTAAASAAAANLSAVYGQLQQKTDQSFAAMAAVVKRHMGEVNGTAELSLSALAGSFSAKLAPIPETVGRIFAGAHGALSEQLSAAQATVSAGVAALREKLNFSWSLPRIKLPHFSVSGSFSLSPPSVPSFSVSWYKKAMDNAMLLTEPTIFGAAGRTLLGGGEAGTEVVAGADTLMGMIRSAAGESDREILSLLRRIAEAVQNEKRTVSLTLDGAALAEASFDRLVSVGRARGTEILNERVG